MGDPRLFLWFKASGLGFPKISYLLLPKNYTKAFFNYRYHSALGFQCYMVKTALINSIQGPLTIFQHLTKDII